MLLLLNSLITSIKRKKIKTKQMSRSEFLKKIEKFKVNFKEDAYFTKAKEAISKKNLKCKEFDDCKYAVYKFTYEKDIDEYYINMLNLFLDKDKTNKSLKDKSSIDFEENYNKIKEVLNRYLKKSLDVFENLNYFINWNMTVKDFFCLCRIEIEKRNEIENNHNTNNKNNLNSQCYIHQINKIFNYTVLFLYNRSYKLKNTNENNRYYYTYYELNDKTKINNLKNYFDSNNNDNILLSPSSIILTKDIENLNSQVSTIITRNKTNFAYIFIDNKNGTCSGISYTPGLIEKFATKPYSMFKISIEDNENIASHFANGSKIHYELELDKKVKSKSQLNFKLIKLECIESNEKILNNKDYNLIYSINDI